MLVIIVLILAFGIYFTLENQKITQKLKIFEEENFKKNSDQKEQAENPKQE